VKAILVPEKAGESNFVTVHVRGTVSETGESAEFVQTIRRGIAVEVEDAVFEALKSSDIEFEEISEDGEESVSPEAPAGGEGAGTVPPDNQGKGPGGENTPGPDA
jgi:hypothetical protein